MANDSRKIGNYIHLHAESYRAYGINRTEKSNDEGYLENYRTEIKRKLGDLPNKDLGKYQKRLQEILSAPESSPYYDKIRNWIVEQLQSRFAGFSFNFTTGDVASLKGQIKNAMTDLSRIIVSKNKAGIQKNTIASRVNALKTAIGQMAEGETKNTLVANLNKIDETWNYLKKLTDKELSNAGVRKGELPLSDEKVTNVIAQINEAIGTLLSPIRLAKGEFLEYAGYAAALSLMYEGQEALMKAMNEQLNTGVVGLTGKSSIHYDKADFPEKVFEKLSFAKFNKADDKLISANQSQHKIDVLVTLPDAGEVRLSMKNIAIHDKADMHILGGSPLLYLLQGEDTTFVNHYLNLAAEHPDEDSDLENGRGQAVAALRLAILFKAFTGQTKGRKDFRADYMVVNDNTAKNGGVYVVSIRDIINHIIHNNTAFKVTIGSQNGEELSAQTRFTNAKIDSADERIAALLANVHAQKIHAAVPSTVVKAVSKSKTKS